MGLTPHRGFHRLLDRDIQASHARIDQKINRQSGLYLFVVTVASDRTTTVSANIRFAFPGCCRNTTNRVATELQTGPLPGSGGGVISTNNESSIEVNAIYKMPNKTRQKPHFAMILVLEYQGRPRTTSVSWLFYKTDVQGVLGMFYGHAHYQPF